jgi:hypothetical protein
MNIILCSPAHTPTFQRNIQPLSTGLEVKPNKNCLFLAVFSLGTVFNPEIEGDVFLGNDGGFLPESTLLHPTR